MTASGFLPQITQPTRITKITMTIIDNIYNNTFTDNIYSGDLLLEIADHLAQFVCAENKNISKTNNDKYKRDYKNWNEQSFLDDLSSKIGKMICRMSWLRASSIFRQLCNSTSEWRRFESRRFCESRFEFAKTPLLILNHERCGSISCLLIL